MLFILDTVSFPRMQTLLNVLSKVVLFLSVLKQPGYAQDLSHRKYITNIINNHPSHFRDIEDRVHDIAIESIKSVNDGSYEIGVGKARR